MSDDAAGQSEPDQPTGTPAPGKSAEPARAAKPEPATRPRKRGLSGPTLAVLIIVGVVIAVVIAVPAALVGNLSHHYSREAITPVTTRVKAMPCVTWATGSTSSGGESAGPGGDIQVGLGKSCTAGQVAAAYDYVENAFSRTRLDTFDFYVTPSSTGTRRDAASTVIGGLAPTTDDNGNSDGGVFDGNVTTTIAQLDISSTNATITDVRHAASDWLTLQHDVDSNAQVSLGDDVTGSQTIEYLQVNAKQADLPRLRQTLPASLQAHPWSVTINAHSPSTTYPGANTNARTAATISTDSGFPSAALVDLAVAGSNGFTNSGYVLVTSGTIQEQIESSRGTANGTPPSSTPTASGTPAETTTHDVALRVFGTSDPTEDELTGSSAWPAITGTIDTLDADGTPFMFGLGFFDDDFSVDPLDSSQDTGIDLDEDTSIAVLDSSTCGKPEAQDASAAPDLAPDPVVNTLAAYWLAPTRHQAPNSAAARCS